MSINVSYHHITISALYCFSINVFHTNPGALTLTLQYPRCYIYFYWQWRTIQMSSVYPLVCTGRTMSALYVHFAFLKPVVPCFVLRCVGLFCLLSELGYSVACTISAHLEFVFELDYIRISHTLFRETLCIILPRRFTTRYWLEISLSHCCWKLFPLNKFICLRN